MARHSGTVKIVGLMWRAASAYLAHVKYTSILQNVPYCVRLLSTRQVHLYSTKAEGSGRASALDTLDGHCTPIHDSVNNSPLTKFSLPHSLYQSSHFSIPTSQLALTLPLSLLNSHSLFHFHFTKTLTLHSPFPHLNSILSIDFLPSFNS